MSCKHEFDILAYDDEVICEFCIWCRKTLPAITLEQKLAAANARIAELEQQQFAGQTWVTFDEHMKALQEIARREQAEAQCNEMEVVNTELQAQNKLMREALDAANVIVGNLENETKVENKHLNAFYRAKAALEEK